MSTGSPPRERRDPGAPGSPWRPVAVVSAIALGAIGAAAAPRLGFPAALGAVAGGLAAILAVVALPSLPTRRVAVVMLGLAGLGALRHAALPTTDSTLIVLWAGATLVALVLVDRAQAERIPQLAQGHALAPRVPEALRVAALVAAIVVVVAVAVVPTVTDHVGRRMWPGTLPSLGDGLSAPGSLRTTPRLDMTSRPRLSDRVVFTVDAPARTSGGVRCSTPGTVRAAGRAATKACRRGCNATGTPTSCSPIRTTSGHCTVRRCARRSTSRPGSRRCCSRRRARCRSSPIASSSATPTALRWCAASSARTRSTRS